MPTAVHQGCQECLFRILTAQGLPPDKGHLLSAADASNPGLHDASYPGLHLWGARDTLS